MTVKKVVIPEETELEAPMSEEEPELVEYTTEEDEASVDEELEEGRPLEELDPNEEVWPEGPTVGMILQWKEEFGDVYVLSLTFDKHVVWRTMTRPEYRQMIRDMEDASTRGNLTSADLQLFQEEYITDLCTLFHNGGSAADDIAGMATAVSQEVMNNSGFVPLEMRQL